MDKKQSVVLSLVLGLATLAALPAQAYVIGTSGGFTTSTPGAVTFADFDTPVTVDPAYATITGGYINGGSNPGAGGNWLCATNNAVYCNVVTINFTGLENYFGLYWGSNDGAANIVTLFNGATQVGQITGQGPANSFFNITAVGASEYFNRIELTTTGGVGFEVDNLAVQQVPEPLSAALLGLGLAGLGFSRRKKA